MTIGLPVVIICKENVQKLRLDTSVFGSCIEIMTNKKISMLLKLGLLSYMREIEISTKLKAEL